MLTLPFVLLELLFVLLKPQEMYPQLQAFAPLYTLPSLIVLGFFFDSGRFLLAARRISLAPYAPYAVGFLVWCVLTLARKPDKIVPDLLQLTTALLIGLGIAHGAQTWKKFYTVTGAMLLLTLFLAFVGDHQHFAPTRCFFMYEDSDLPLQYDGRLCGSTGAIHDGEIDAEECYLGETDPERHYICAHAGLMETSSVGERVRFRGILEDPNELSLTIALGVPMSFALFQRKKTALRGLLVALTLGLVGACIVFTQSRGGQLVILAVLGTYFIRRAGFGKGIIAAAVAAVPVLMLGGRSGDSADESATERMELLQLGISYVREHPILGVGKGQFSSTNVEINGLTAHNSYLLCASELGMPGMLIWSVVMYLAMKIPLSALRPRRARHVLSPSWREHRCCR